MPRYYQDEHESTYREILREGLLQWNDRFEPGRWTFDTFQNRDFLGYVLETYLPESHSGLNVLEYGCGTGTAACFLAAKGFTVDAMDLMPDAISIAKSEAEQRRLSVNFYVADVCDDDFQNVDAQYDLVLDSYCLQSIVLDEDREALFSAVRKLLKPSGLYVISTALLHPDRVIDDSHHFDEETDTLYRTKPDGFQTADAVEIDGQQMIPQRRHRTAFGIGQELAAAGFTVLENGNHAPGDLVCRLTSTSIQP